MYGTIPPYTKKYTYASNIFMINLFLSKHSMVSTCIYITLSSIFTVIQPFLLYLMNINDRLSVF